MTQKHVWPLALAAAFFFSPAAHARRHHHFKGVIVVNQILKLDGTITNNGKPALEYSGVHPGDVLETGDKSMAVIRIPGLAVFKMYADTRLRLTGFSDRNESRFEIEKGSVLNLFRRQGHHVVTLPHGILTLHGTTFFAKVTDDSDQICLCDGKILAQVKAEKGAKRKTATTTAAATAGPVASPQPSPYSGAIITAEPTAAASSASSPVATPEPSPAPSPIYQIEISSSNEHKQFEILPDGIEIKDLKLLDFHSNKEIQDLNSLYDLP